MRERPILFSAPMVRAILDGTKTQTRRVVKPQPEMVSGNAVTAWSGDAETLMRLLGNNGRRCPYGMPGDRLWVREQWRIGAWLAPEPGSRCWAGHLAVDYLADNFVRREWLPVMDTDMYNRMEAQSITDAEHAGAQRDARGLFQWEPGTSPCRKRQSRFMPRWASRILLEIVSVRVERLQDISEADATAEGTPHSLYFASGRTAKENFAHLWECINGEGSWNANPWVWAVEFRRISP